MNSFFNEKTSPLRIFSLIAAITAVALGIFNGIMNVIFFEAKTYMYSPDSNGAMLAYCTLCALFVLAAVVFCAVSKFKKQPFTPALSVTDKNNVVSGFKIAQIFCGTIFAAGAIMRFAFYFTEKPQTGLPSVAVTAMLISFLFFAVYLLPDIWNKFGVPSFGLICGVAGAPSLIIDTLSVYSDMSIPIASEYRLFTAAFSIFFLLALVSELRMKIADPHPYVYVAVTSIAAVIGGSLCIGRTISVLSGNSVSNTELARTVCGLGFTVYLIARLITTAFKREYLEDCGGIPYEAPLPLFGEEFENCGGIPSPAPIPQENTDTVSETEEIKETATEENNETE